MSWAAMGGAGLGKTEEGVGGWRSSNRAQVCHLNPARQTECVGGSWVWWVRENGFGETMAVLSRCCRRETHLNKEMDGDSTCSEPSSLRGHGWSYRKFLSTHYGGVSHTLIQGVSGQFRKLSAGHNRVFWNKATFDISERQANRNLKKADLFNWIVLCFSTTFYVEATEFTKSSILLLEGHSSPQERRSKVSVSSARIWEFVANPEWSI